MKLLRIGDSLLPLTPAFAASSATAPGQHPFIRSPCCAVAETLADLKPNKMSILEPTELAGNGSPRENGAQSCAYRLAASNTAIPSPRPPLSFAVSGKPPHHYHSNRMHFIHITSLTANLERDCEHPIPAVRKTK